ncbi:MAG: AAA family ATPase [Phycisphaeraceae bacterium]
MNTRADILEQLARQARKLRVGRNLPSHGELPWELVQQVQGDFRFMLEQPGVTLHKVAEALGPGYSRGPLSRFLNASSREQFSGDIDRVTRGINQFLETIARRREAKRPEGWVETEAARRMLLVIAKAVELCVMAIITGDAGRGKTMTMEAAADIHPGSIRVRVRQCSRTGAGLARQIGEALALRCGRRLHEIEPAIIDKLTGTGRCLLIDEAHRLHPDAVELLRDVHDETGCPIVLSGTVKLNDVVSDQGLFFGQLSSRVALRYNLADDLEARGGDGGPKPLHSVQEIRQLYESDKLGLTDEGRLLLQRIANLPGFGGLRLCAKIMAVAGALGRTEPIDAGTLLQILRTLHGQGQTAAQIEPAIARAELRAAG